MPLPALAVQLNEIANDLPESSAQPLAQVQTPEQFNRLRETLGMDSRAVKEAEAGISPVFDGLDFDPLRVRSQAFFITRADRPVAVMTLVVAPQGWIERQRYLRQAEGGLRICDASEALGIESPPNYFIIPAWTKVADDYRTQFSLRGVRFLKRALRMLEAAAPPNTWIELVAQGKHQTHQFPLINDLGVGQVLPIGQCPFPLSDFAAHNAGSAPTVALARLLDLKKLGNIAQAGTLGPVFARAVAK